MVHRGVLIPKSGLWQLGYAGKIEDDVCYQYANNSQSVCQRGYENGFKSNQKWAQTEPYKQGFALSEVGA